MNYWLTDASATNFSERTLHFLRKSGWTPDYYFDPVEYLRKLEERGFTVPASALEFFWRFGGLNIKFNDLQFGGIREYYFELFTPSREAGVVTVQVSAEIQEEDNRIWVEDVHANIGETGCYIGFAEHHLIEFYIDASAQYWFRSEGGGWAMVGVGVDEFIENMFGGVYKIPIFR